MNLEPRPTSSAVGSHRLLLALACLVPLLALAAPPGWWADRQVLDSNATKNDYGPANQGQLKNIATRAYEELQTKLPASTWNSPEGQALTGLVASWNPTQGNNYTPVNQGQLKAVAKIFYDVLILQGYATGYPWTDTTADDANYAPANIGQVKNVFAFDLGGSSIDSDGNGLGDSWEITYFGQIGADPNADPDGDGLTNLQEYQNNTNPIDYFNGQAPSLTKISGDNQEGAPGSFLPLPFVVKVTNSTGQALNNAPVTFAVVDGGGLLAASSGGATATFLQTRTDSAGLVTAFYLQASNVGVTSHIAAIAAATQVTFVASNGQPQGLTIVPGDINATVNAGANSLVPLTLTNNTSDPISYTVRLDGDKVDALSYADSDQLGGPVFVWNDISATGTRLDAISDADDDSEAVDLSFAFPYFGSTYSNVFVNSNGFVTLGSSGGDYIYYRLPDPNAPANEIAAFHTDLYLDENGGGSGDVYFRDFGDRAIIQFNLAARLAQDGFSTFQIVLNADGTILFYYLDMSGTLDDCVVGLQNETKDKGLTVAYQQHYLKNNLAVRLVDSTRWLSVSPTSGTLAAGGNTTLDVVLDARSLVSGSYNGAVTISANSLPDVSVTVPVAMNINAGPEVSITSPGEGWLFTEASDITLQASALDQDGVSKVEFYDGAVKLGDVASAPYSFQWQNLPRGTRAITALAVDNLGAVRRSSPVHLEVQADTDHDGIGDEWEMSYFGSLEESAEGDFDHDGLTNAEEWASRVNPTLSDTDGDGVSDGDEVHVYHTDPTQTDSDGDGLSDDWEINYGLDPLHDDSQVDADNDGLTNAEELSLGTVPNNPDTDGDGVLDGTDGWPLHPQLAPARLPAVKYAVIDLGEGFAAALNNHGDVIGTNGQTPSEAMLWKIGQSPVALGFLTDDASAYRVSAASAINDDGIVVGRASYSWDPVVGTDYPDPPIYNQLLTRFDNTPEHNLWWDTHAFRWSGGVMTDLNDLSYGHHGDGTTPDTSNKASSAAASINQGGLIVGGSDSSLEVNSGFYWEISSDVEHAVRFDGGVPVDLGLAPPAEGDTATAYAINDSGSIIGVQSSTDSEGGYFFAGGQIATLPFGPTGLNNLDQVVGTIRQGSRFLASMWVNQPLLPGADRLLDLDAIARNSGFTGSSFASKIGDRVEILGEATPPGSSQSAAAIWRNGQIFRLDDLADDPAWTITTAAINANGMIAASGFNNVSPNGDRALLLLPVELMVDGNRDGEMSFDDAAVHDRDATTEVKPYRFWLNNDHDEERSVDNDDREQDDYDESPDFNNQGLLCERDLEDWSRLWINFKGIVDLVKEPGVTLELAWKPLDGGISWPAADGNPGIKVMLHDILAGAGSAEAAYVTDRDKASAQVQGIWGGFIRPVSTNGGYTLTNDWLQMVTEEQPYLNLLFEGWTAGRGQLVLNIKKDGQTIGEYPPVYIELKDVKDMYERYTVGDVIEAGVNYSAPWPTSHATKVAASAFVAPTDETKDYILYVHGWNMSPFDKDNYGDTSFKRLWWQGYKGRFGCFRWPTFWFADGEKGSWLGEGSVRIPGTDIFIPNPKHFDASEHRAWASSLGLLDLCNQLNGQGFSGKLRLIAHSMGNVVVGEALRRAQSGQVIHTYIASQAALSAHCYDSTTQDMEFYIGFGPDTPDAYAHYFDSNATSYMHADVMAGKAGRYFNYLNEDDYALNGVHWQLDQQFKPDDGYHYDQSPNGTGSFDWFYRLLTQLRLVDDRYEIFSWAAESRSLALGAQVTQGVMSQSLSLKSAPFGFGNQHKFHSGQFRGMNMERRHYWERLLIDCGLKEPQ